MPGGGSVVNSCVVHQLINPIKHNVNKEQISKSNLEQQLSQTRLHQLVYVAWCVFVSTRGVTIAELIKNSTELNYKLTLHNGW